MKTGLAPVFLYPRKEGSAKIQQQLFACPDSAVFTWKLCRLFPLYFTSHLSGKYHKNVTLISGRSVRAGHGCCAAALKWLQTQVKL
jgi:hypothetical protein